MPLSQDEWAQSNPYMSAFETSIGGERSKRIFQGLIQGIIEGESLRADVIARFSPRNG